MSNVHLDIADVLTLMYRTLTFPHFLDAMTHFQMWKTFYLTFNIVKKIDLCMMKYLSCSTDK